MSEERFDRLEQLISDMARATDQRFEAINQQFEGIDQQFEGIDRRFEGIDRRFEAVDQRFEAIDRRFDAIDRKFDAVDRKFDAIDRRFQEADQRSSYVGTRLDRLEAGQSQLAGQIGELHVGQQELYARFDRLSDDLGAQMRMLHEDVISRLAITRELPGITRHEFSERNEATERRIEPLEVLPSVVREHDIRLRRHETEIEALKRKRR